MLFLYQHPNFITKVKMECNLIHPLENAVISNCKIKLPDFKPGNFISCILNIDYIKLLLA